MGSWARAAVVLAGMSLGCRGGPGGGAAADAAPDATEDGSAEPGAPAAPALDLGSPDAAAPPALDAGTFERLPAVCEPCAAYAPARTVGNLREPLLDELSGLAASRVHAGVLYGHNDDDDTVAQFFAFDATGRRLGRFVAEGGARKLDTEDIAVGPCPSGSCVYLADAGDGGRNRTTPIRPEYALFRFAEPDVPAAAPDAITFIPYERFRFTYPDGSHDSEALVVDPTAGTVYLVTKVRSGPTSVYRLPEPLHPEAVNVAVKIGDLPITRVDARDDIQVTAASAHPCGAAVLVRTYSHLYEFRRPSGAPFAAVFAALPARWSGTFAAEAITYRQDGQGYLTAPEGVGARIAEAVCR